MTPVVPLSSVVIRAVENDVPQVPQRAYVRSAESVDRALSIPLAEMQRQDGLRLRSGQQTATNASHASGESSGDQGDLTPTSSDGSQDNEVPRALSSTTATCSRETDPLVLQTTTSSSLSRSDVRANDKEDFNKRHGYNKIIKEKIEHFAIGFPQLAFIQRSDDDLLMFRGFHQIQVRILEYMEVEMTRMEEKLQAMDMQDQAKQKMHYRLTTTEQKNGQTEKDEFFQKLKMKMTEYQDFLLKYNQIKTLGKPAEYNYRSLFNWVFNKRPLYEEYDKFMYHEGDFVALGKPSNPGHLSETVNSFASFIRTRAIFWFPSLMSFLITKKETNKTRDPNVHYLSASRLNILTRILTVTTSVASILLPILLLFQLSASRLAMSIIVLVCAVAFPILISLATSASLEQQIFGTVAYGALLSAFLVTSMNQCSGSCRC